ncbi:MAG: hypothetical protein GY822_23045 [Deltaproteobacteria bacterium]|nr:hypothetical protein [Deltaproteobacteria bacterium]
MQIRVWFPRVSQDTSLKSSPSKVTPWGLLLLSAVALSLAPLGCAGDGGDPCIDDPTAADCSTTPEEDAGTAPEEDAGTAEEDAGTASDGGTTADAGSDGGACAAGAEGCECGFNDYCADFLACESGTCVAPPCVSGDLDCPCLTGESCNPGPFGELLTCGNVGFCELYVDDSPSPGEPNYNCYTPCSESLELPNGTFRFCSPEGLMAGCLAGLNCVEGSCLEEGEEPLTCDTPTDCPEHQACVGGRCLSNCQYDSECNNESGCINFVCRELCTTSVSNCSEDFFCNTAGGEDGYCIPQLTDDVEPVTETQDLPFTLSSQSLTFNNNQVTNQFTITNEGERSATFLVKKVEHTKITIDGRLLETDLPLFWMEMGVSGEEARQQSFEIEIGSGESKDIVLGNAFNETIDKWQGRIEVSSTKLGSREIYLEYSTRPDGQWSGSIYYFINFADVNIDVWVNSIRNSNHSNEHNVAAVATGNAFLTEWTRFRDLSSYKQRQFDAMLGATVTGSWEMSSIVNACKEEFGETEERCYLYASGSQGDKGIKQYTDSGTTEIPTGVLEMPFTIRLQDDGTSSNSYQGRVESSIAMQYPGLPPVSLKFAGDPAACEDPFATSCIAQISEFSSTILVGARYAKEDASACAEASYENVEVPWLVEEFTEGVEVNAAGRMIRRECREKTFPISADADTLAAAKNRSFAGANPIPDGRVRKRNVNLLDGIMINQTTLVMLVEESFEANLDDDASPADFSAYGIVVLRRSGGDIDSDGFTPGVVPDEMNLEEPESKMDLVCSPDIIEEVTGSTDIPNNTSEWAALIKRIMEGRSANAPDPLADESEVHYLCHETGRFDGGRSAWGVQGGEPCPLGSGVTFFVHPSNLQDHYCQGNDQDFCGENEDCEAEKRGSCADILDDMATEAHVFVDIPWKCTDSEQSVCSDDRYDMRVGKDFWNPAHLVAEEPVFKPLGIEIAEAFRYKTRFQSRSGTSIGFVPDICAFNSDQLPYCYDPQAIERAAAKVTCLLSAYGSGNLDGTSIEETVFDFLTSSFSQGSTTDGFEHLYAELLIMLGDEALTNAVASRFDLAGTQVSFFEGDLLEPDGIQLAGSVGNEMKMLYKSLQYFQMVMSRFHAQSPAMWDEITRDEGLNRFITFGSISTYFKRLILASTRKAKAASEIARRYQAFNRADLARHVIERAYTEAYLESVTVSQFMRRTASVVDPHQTAGLNYELLQAQRRYTQALQHMREVYIGITDEVTFFGDAPDFIPFPAPGRFDVPSVHLMIDRAFETLRVAKEREERALASNRAFDVDAAQFQSELARIKQQYETELGDLCGTFDGADGHIYPAIPKYSHLSVFTQLLGNPCGLLGHGDLYDQIGNLEARALDLRAEIQDIRDVHSRVAIEQTRVDDECNGRVQIAQVRFTAATETLTLQEEISESNQDIQEWERTLSVIDRQVRIASNTAATLQGIASSLSACTSLTGAAACGVAMAASAGAVIANGVAIGFEADGLSKQREANTDIGGKENDIRAREKEIAELNRDADYETAIMECCLDDGLVPGEPLSGTCENPGPLVVNSNAQVDQYLVDLMRAEIEAHRASVEIQRIRGTIRSMSNKAERLIAQQEETEQHLISVEAARNDPNVRIYANADVLSADKSFRDALIDAYRGTRMLEYYTAQTYAQKGDLYLVRMAGRGEDNLEDYLLDLQRSFNEFEQSYGRPALRVQLVSLRDDIFAIPRTDDKGVALLPAERATMLRERILDLKLLDDRGYIRIPFATTLKDTSPLTAIHKLAYVEAEIHGSDVGDRVGRLYLTSKGTSTIKSLDDVHNYHRMDPITAVLNPYFNGVRVFDTEIYRNDRLRDRPLVNSLWELTLNLRDEAANFDVNPNSITDVRLYMFYEDFTEL